MPGNRAINCPLLEGTVRPMRGLCRQVQDIHVIVSCGADQLNVRRNQHDSAVPCWWIANGGIALLVISDLHPTNPERVVTFSTYLTL